MAIYKCKMCGGNLIPSGDGFGVCDSCGLSQSLTEQSAKSSSVGFDKYLSFENDYKKETDGRIEPLIKRAFLFLEDGNWKSADEYFEKILDIDPEYAPVYLGKLMIEYRVTKPEYLSGLSVDFSKSGNYQKAVRYGDQGLKKDLEDMHNQAKVNEDNSVIQNKFTSAVAKMNNAGTQKAFAEAAELFKQVGDFQNAADLADVCSRKAEEMRCDEIYNNALKAEAKGDNDSLEAAIKLFKGIQNYKDSSARITKCEEKLRKAKSFSTAKNLGIYIATAVFIVFKLICSGVWSSKLNPLVIAVGDIGIGEWLEMLLNVIGLMILEVVLTSIVSVLASKCIAGKLRLGGIIMLVLTLVESFMMSVIDNPQIFSDMHRKIFMFYLVFSLVCNFTLYVLMLIITKIRKSITK